MATVYDPQMPRRYNYNPRGSATTQVTMPSHNPFEQRTRLVNRSGMQDTLAGFQPSGALPGMGHFGSFLGDTPATATWPVLPANAGAGGDFQDSAADVAALTAASGSDNNIDQVTDPTMPDAPTVAAAAPAQLTPYTGNIVATPIANTAPPASAAFNWNNLFSTALTSGGTVTAAVLKDKYGNPVVPGAKPAGVAAAAGSMTPWLIGGGVLALLAVYMMTRK